MDKAGKVLIAQGGGPTAVINQTLAGIILEARKFERVTKVYGALNGVSGIVAEDLIDLTQETSHNLEQVALTPSSALLSTRVKPDQKFCQDIFKVLKAHDVRYFFYIGGNDSSDTVKIVNDQAKLANYDLCAIHVPKTIDNDVVVNDHTPGYGSAARFIVQAFSGINLDVRALPGVYIGVVMGRNAGFLTAASGLAQKYPGDGPHLIYLPEREFSIDQFLLDVKQMYDQHGRCIVAVSEGVKDHTGNPIISKLKNLDQDAHGNLGMSGTGALGDLLAEIVKDKLDISRVRSDTFGYLQRSFMGCVSDVDQYEAREAGERAVHFALWNRQREGSVTIHRTGYYSVDYQLTPLEDVAAKTKLMPDEFINKAGNHVTDAFKFYVRPLLGSGLQSPAQLRAPKVDKLL